MVVMIEQNSHVYQVAFSMLPNLHYLKKIILKFTYIWKVNEDERYISRCLELAAKGMKWVQPNPMVGAVIVEQREVLAEGYHHQVGDPHAEVDAIQKVQDRDLTASTIYVNLEPCSHHGRTPPCADLIIEKKFKRVVIGALDPNPLVAGSGLKRLKDAGIEVHCNVLESQCRDLNKVFYHFHENKRPYITLKWAETADGFIGRHSSEDHLSQQISNQKSRPFVHELRAEHMAILIGANTANRDNPQLNLRYAKGRDPIKIILSKNNTLDPHLKLFNEGKVLVYNSLRSFSEENTDYIQLHHKYFMREMLEDLYSRNISSILVEGGAQVHQSFIEHDLFDQIYRIIGTAEWGKGVKAALAPNISYDETTLGNNLVYHYFRS